MSQTIHIHPGPATAHSRAAFAGALESMSIDAGDDHVSHHAGHRVSAFDLVARTPWAILPDALNTIAAIARRENGDIEAVEARLGRPLQNARSVTVRDGVAVVPLTGPIFRYANLFTEISGATSLEVFARDFAAAIDDPAVHAVVLNLDSPGGQASGISEVAQMIRAGGEKKPVVAYVDDTAASGAYWLGVAAQEVVISRTGMVGSIGAVISLRAGKDPSTVEIVSSQSPNKRPDVSTAEGRAQIQSLIDSLAQIFVDDVAAYRGVDAAKVLADFGGGGMRIGAEAVALGMADRVGTLEGLIAELAPKAAKGYAAPGAARPSSSTKGNSMKTIDELRAAHPELCAQLEREAVASLTAESLFAANPVAHANVVSAERARIVAIQAHGKRLPGHDVLVASLVADGKSAPEAAEAILAAEGSKLDAAAAALGANAAHALPHAAAPTVESEAAADASLPVEERCKAAWEKDPKVRAEFVSLASFTAFTAAQEAGKVSVLGRRKA